MGDPNNSSFNTQSFLQENPSFQSEYEKKERNQGTAKRLKESRRQEARQGWAGNRTGGNDDGYESEHGGWNPGEAGGNNGGGGAHQDCIYNTLFD